MKLTQAELLAESLKTMLDTKGIVGYKIAYNLRKINEELKEYYVAKTEIFRKYGTEKDGIICVEKGSDNYPLFLKEIAPLNDEECEINFKTFTEEELVNSGLNANQMMFLMSNFEGEEK